MTPAAVEITRFTPVCADAAKDQIAGQACPAERKATILDELRPLNVTSEVLFPSVDEAASAITQQQLDRMNKS